MSAYYNEHDPQAASWLRELIKQGHIADGIVDERSIEDITPDELSGFTQCHFFAGIGVWSYALRQAGWPDDRPVWTGSCPCQAFSAAGKGAGFADERHLWPAWFHLIEQCRPPVIFGEQVEAAVRYGWLDLVQDDLEGSGYACGAVAFPAAGVGAPHIRQRLYFVAHPVSCGQSRPGGSGSAQDERTAERGVLGGVADTEGAGPSDRRTGTIQPFACCNDRTDNEVADADGWNASAEREQSSWEQRQQQEDSRIDGLANTKSDGNDGALRHYEREKILKTLGRSVDLPEHKSASPTNGFWGAADWLHCTDGKWRPVEPGTFPLAHGSPARVGRLRGYGNAIVAPAAQAFIEGFMSL